MDNDTLRSIALAVMALGQTFFTLLYLTLPWWRNFLGRALFAKAAVMTIVLDFAALARILGFANVDAAFTALYFLLGITIWAQGFAFMRVKMDGARVKREFYDSQVDYQQRFPETRQR